MTDPYQRPWTEKPPARRFRRTDLKTVPQIYLEQAVKRLEKEVAYLKEEIAEFEKKGETWKKYGPNKEK